MRLEIVVVLLNKFYYYQIDSNESLYLFIEQILGHSEKQRYDGWYNNLAHPDWGTVGESIINKI